MPHSPQDAEQTPEAVLFFVLWRGLAHKTHPQQKTTDKNQSLVEILIFVGAEGFEPPTLCL